MTPFDRYYTSLTGRWTGDYHFRVVDGGGGWQRIVLRAMALISPMRIQTSLARDGNDFVHTTRVSRFGIPLMATRERITAEPDGHHLRMEGVQRMGPLPAGYECGGEIAGDGQSARYDIPWMGRTLIQRMTIVPDGLLMEHEVPGGRGEALLRRLTASE